MTPGGRFSSLADRIAALDWSSINNALLENGFVVTKPILHVDECKALRELYDRQDLFRSTIDMQRHNFGRGTYRYFKYPLPAIIQTLREGIYAQVAATATVWAQRIHYKTVYPATFAAFAKVMRTKGQTRPTPLILRYETGDYNCLHQDIANDLIFPYQVAFGLSASGRDYEGGQFILIQQRPRMQTVPHVIVIPQGAGVLFASNYHPQRGARGFYRTVFKHGVGRIESGERYTLGIVFHDYRSGVSKGNGEAP
jgi:hypothetical protein